MKKLIKLFYLYCSCKKRVDCFLFVFFFIQVVSGKTLCGKDFTRNLIEIFIRNNHNYNPYKLSNKFSFITCFSFRRNQKLESNFQQFSELATRNVPVFFVYSESHSTSKVCQMQQTFIKRFSYMLFLLVLQFYGFTRKTSFQIAKKVF